MIKNFEVLLYL